MTVDEILAKLASRNNVRPAWLMSNLNMNEERFNELFGHIEVSNVNGFAVMAVEAVRPILENF